MPLNQNVHDTNQVPQFLYTEKNVRKTF